MSGIKKNTSKGSCLSIFGITSRERCIADLDAIIAVHRISANERMELARIITGAIPGNRDRPLFLLALHLFASGTDDLLSLILPGAMALRRVDAALLDFLLTAALDSAENVTELVAAFRAARSEPDPSRAFVPTLSKLLHAYRVRCIPEAQHHNVFVAARRYLVTTRPEDPSPRDGDAPGFWAAEGRRDFLTRYATALRALADYAEATRLAASWREPVPLDLADAMAAAGPDAVEHAWTAEDSLGPDRLATSLGLLAEAPIKLLLANERESLAALADHSDLVLRWPGDVQAALTLGPVQSTITQALRRTGGPVDVMSLINKGPSRQEVLDRIEDLDASLSACLHLIHQSITPATETSSVRSSVPDVDTRRIAALRRRQGFGDLPAESRHTVLTGLIEPVLLLSGLLQRYGRAWERLGPERGMALERAHRELFKEKFTVMYGAGQKG